MGSNAASQVDSVIPGSIALCRRPRTWVVRPTHFTSFATGSAHAQPADPRTSLSTLSLLALAASRPLRISALRRLSHPPAKPPCRFSDRQGSWFEPKWRDGGVEPSTPSWSSSGTDRGRSTTPSAVARCSRLSTPLAPRISHPQPPERMPSPDILTPNRHYLTFCSACSLVGAGPVSRRLLAPDADADADANGADRSKQVE